MSLTVEQALRHWKEKGLLTEAKARELQASLREDAIPSRALGIFGAIGAILIGLGFILFVSSHWNEMTPTVRILILVASMLASGIGGFVLLEDRGYVKTGMAFQFVNIMVFGATIFLVAQIYHIQLQFWWGMLLWLIGTLYFAYMLQSKLHLGLAVIQLILTLGWYRASLLGVGGGELDFLFEDRSSFFFLLPVIGFSLMNLGLLHRGSNRFSFASSPYFRAGTALLALPMIISTFDKYVLFHVFRFSADPVSLALLATAVALFIATLLKVHFVTKNGRAALATVAGYVLFAFLLSTLLPQVLGIAVDGTGYVQNHFIEFDAAYRLFILHVIVTALIFMLAVWFGILLKHEYLVNIGMIGIALIIFAQYFTWAFQLLPRSLFFVMSGLVILAFTWYLERKRRALIAAFA